MVKRKNLWKCPACDKVVDYGEERPSRGKTQCDATGKTVQMVKVRAAGSVCEPPHGASKSG